MSKDNSNFNILLVDDETDLGEVCVEILQLNGYTVKYFSNGIEALESVKNSEEIQLLITDINMDTITGPRLFSELSQKIKTNDVLKLPVIFMSGEYELKVEFLDPNSCSIYYLPKPFQINDLLNQVSQIYQKHARPADAKIS